MAPISLFYFHFFTLFFLLFFNFANIRDRCTLSYALFIQKYDIEPAIRILGDPRAK